jgi:hypothetical protein
MKDKLNGLCETCQVKPTDCALKWNAWLDIDPDNKYPAIIRCADYKGIIPEREARMPQFRL